LYDDQHEHRLEGRHALSEKGRADVARWIRFLETSLPYEWGGVWEGTGLMFSIANLLTFTLLGRYWNLRFERMGIFEFWPFASREQYAAVLREDFDNAVQTD
jgi:hypothetical protein